MALPSIVVRFTDTGPTPSINSRVNVVPPEASSTVTEVEAAANAMVGGKIVESVIFTVDTLFTPTNVPLPGVGVSVTVKVSTSSISPSPLICIEICCVVSPAANGIVCVAPTKSSPAVADTAVTTASTDAARGVPDKTRSSVTVPVSSATVTLTESAAKSIDAGGVVSTMLIVELLLAPTSVASPATAASCTVNVSVPSISASVLIVIGTTTCVSPASIVTG